MASLSRGAGLFGDDLVLRVREAQDLAGDLFDEIGVGQIRTQERHVAFELGAHGFETRKLKLKSAFTLKKSFPSLETVAAFPSVMGEICRQPQAEKQHRGLPEFRSPII